MNTQVSTFRLYLLRATYLLIVVGLGSMIWPSILDSSKTWELMHGVVTSMLAAFSAMALLGLRYPLQMLPVLFWELAWKSIWLLRVALPLWSAHRMDAPTEETMYQCLWVVIVPIVIPWRHVFEKYVKQPGDRWHLRADGSHPVGKAITMQSAIQHRNKTAACE